MGNYNVPILSGFWSEMGEGLRYGFLWLVWGLIEGLMWILDGLQSAFFFITGV